ncbi:MAG: hypothetical protein AAGI51_14160, partial [Pseudomonadota bacterium]
GPPPGAKRDMVRRWALPDRMFFGFGACHILAGAALEAAPIPGLRAERIAPRDGLPGFHVFVTDGRRAFDFHGCSDRAALLAHHARAWRRRHPDWRAEIEPVDYDLFDTAALNARRMLGPCQYLHDPRPRARAFLARFHPRASAPHPAADAFQDRPSPLTSP